MKPKKGRRSRLVGVAADRAHCSRHGSYVETVVYIGEAAMRAGCPHCKRTKKGKK